MIINENVTKNISEIIRKHGLVAEVTHTIGEDTFIIFANKSTLNVEYSADKTYVKLILTKAGITLDYKIVPINQIEMEVE